MVEQSADQVTGFVAGCEEPVFAIPVEEDGREVVRYFTDERAAAAATTDQGIQEALDLAGAWSDLDWDEMEATLYRMRHETPPTPPIEEL